MEKRKKIKKTLLLMGLLNLSLICIIAVLIISQKKPETFVHPEQLFKQYTTYIKNQKYKKMYTMLNAQSKINISQEKFITRNQKIYEGMEVDDIKIKIQDVQYGKNKVIVISYYTELNTLAGKIDFENQAVFTKEEGEYYLQWNDSMIIPDLKETDKIRVSTLEAKRGSILDRNNILLAGEGVASSIGLVPGKMKEDASRDIAKLAQLLDISVELIEKKLTAAWVKKDSFVPIKTIESITQHSSLVEESEKTLQNKLLQEQLLTISGIQISDVPIRTYPLKETASHLIGYVQNITAEELEKQEGKGYTSNSVIGKSGLESLYEKELKGKDGHEIAIITSEGKTKEVLISVPKEDGKDIKLTIDSRLQPLLYNEFQNDKSCSVIMNSLTGEILALVSTPSYDNNDFIFGMSYEKWDTLNEDKAKPFYNRFRSYFCPGSSFKPIIAAIGLSLGVINPNENYGNVGLSWRKDASWGNYYVTTLRAYDPVVLEKALIYSDNIYFAKAALKIGAANMAEQLKRIGFHQPLPFEIDLSASKYSNTDTIDSEIQLADSGYGQAQILMNPVHLASIYSAFVNEGNIIKPYLEYKETIQPEIWVDKAFTKEAAQLVTDALIKAVNNSDGTGYKAHMDNVTLAGKTGTAEIKASKEDTSGTELGWFAAFTTDIEKEYMLILISMVEDVKGRGGSNYVIAKDKPILEQIFYGKQ